MFILAPFIPLEHDYSATSSVILVSLPAGT